MKKRIEAFNDHFAALVTNGVGTMWCAYIFAALAIYGSTAVDWHNAFQVVQWISQTFLQLVLLSIIMVGQKVLSSASDKQAKEMHDTVMQSHAEIHKLAKETNHILKEIHAQRVREREELAAKQNPK